MTAAFLSFSLRELFTSVVVAAEDVRGQERVHVCRDGGGGRARRQRCPIEHHLRSVVAPAEALAQDGDTLPFPSCFRGQVTVMRV